METEINTIVPTLRPDLHFTIQEGEDDGYVLEDALRQKFYRIGRAEYVFFTELDGKTDLGAAVVRANGFLCDNLRVFVFFVVRRVDSQSAISSNGG